MVCASPPQPDDTRILSYLDGEADLDVQAHIAQCPHCRQRTIQLAALQGRLIADLYRAVCPTPSELGDYHLGLLPAEQAAAMALHLAECPHCTNEIAQLQVFLADLSPAREPGPLEQARNRVRVLIAQLSSAASTFGPFAQPGLAPAMAGIRGQEQTVRRYQADGVEVVIDLQTDSEQPDRRTILGLIIGLESTGVVATLWQSNQQIAKALVDELDLFVIPAIAPGTYQLVLSGPEIEIVIQNLEIGTRSAKTDPQTQD